MKKNLTLSLVLMMSLGLWGCGISLDTPDSAQLQQMASSGLEYANEQAQDFVQNNEYAQQAQQAANQAIQEAKAQATQLSEQAKAEAQKHYQKLKDDAKAEVKNQVNKKIDETFERF